MILNSAASTLLNSPVRQTTAKVELYNGSTLAATYGYKDDLVSFSVERVGEGKFFGFGICQKVNVKVRDVNRAKDITTANSLKIYFNDLQTLPIFYVTEVHRDENTNQLSITAYDGIYAAAKHTLSELELTAPYTISNVASKIAAALGLVGLKYTSNEALGIEYEDGANFDGSETLRDVLDAIAEATQTIYFVDVSNYLYLKKLDVSGSSVFTIDKSKYITLQSKTNRRLATIIHATELGDNVSTVEELIEPYSSSATTGATGSTQYVRDNPFWELRDDIDILLSDAIAAIGGITINQFDCKWRGNYLLEPGDKIALITKDDEIVYAYLLNDTIAYDGALSQSTKWDYDDNEEETASNPLTLGDALKQTYAKVDKANKQIDLVVSDVAANKESLSALQLNIDGISASVSRVEENTNQALEGVNGELETLTQKVEATMSAEDVRLEIQKELDNGIEKVKTTTGFTFDEDGLTVSKTDSEMTTQITEDGMTVYKNNNEVLVANNVGVEALNLHATTYLIIGTHSRFEDYGNRTGCFWIGG